MESQHSKTKVHASQIVLFPVQNHFCSKNSVAKLAVLGKKMAFQAFLACFHAGTKSACLSLTRCPFYVKQVGYALSMQMWSESPVHTQIAPTRRISRKVAKQ